MKHFSPLALAILLTGCAVTPEGKEAAHQHQLEKEARANFIALKQQEHPGQPVVLNDEAAAARQRKLAASEAQARHGRASISPTTRFEPTAYVAPTPQSRGARRGDDTIYYWQLQAVQRRTTPRQQAAEAKYARELAKRPEDLTSEERMWAHEHY